MDGDPVRDTLKGEKLFMSEVVGVIGLGNAGLSIASALARHFTVVGHDANSDRKEALAGSGIQWADSAEAVTAGAGTVLLSLPHPDISHKVVDAITRTPGKATLLIETSTVTPKVARDLDRKCRAVGIAFVDAGVVGGLKAMVAGETTFLVGAEDADVDMVHRILGPVSGRIFHLGGVGAGSGAKVVNNAVMHAEMVVLLEAVAMAERLGIPTAKMVEILAQPMGIMRPLEHRLGERVLGDNYDNGMSVSNARKDSVLALETAQDLGVPLFATAAAHAPYEIAERLGYGNLDYAVLARLWESWCGVEFKQKAAASNR